MGRGNNKATSSSSSSSMESRNHPALSSTDLRLGLGISSLGPSTPNGQYHDQDHNNYDHDQMMNNSSSLFVKVYMEGIPIGRKLDLLAHEGYLHLIRTLDYMFNTNILWGVEMDAVNTCYNRDKYHVLTYEDEEGDWMMVGDVPWEMFLSNAKRLKITRAFPS